MNWLGIEWAADHVREYGAVIFGLVIGTMAHFGRLLADGELPTWAQAIGYVMQLGLIGLFAVVSTRKMGILDNDIRAMATAVLAISAQEIIRYLKANGWRPFAAEIVPREEERQAAAREEAFHRILRNHDLEKLAKRLDDERKDTD